MPTPTPTLRPQKPRFRYLRRDTRSYRVLSLRTFSLLSMLVVALTATCVFLFGKRSFWIETEWTLAIVSGSLFLFLAFGLYRGIRLRKSDRPTFQVDTLPMDRFTDSGPHLPDVDCPLDTGGDEGCVGAILGALLTLVVGVALIFFLAAFAMVFVNVVIVLVATAAFAVGWVFYRALRQTFARSRQCRGNLAASLQWAATYTLLYTGWLFGVTFAARHFMGDRLSQ